MGYKVFKPFLEVGKDKGYEHYVRPPIIHTYKRRGTKVNTDENEGIGHSGDR